MLTSIRDSEGRNLLMAALEGASVRIVGALVKLIDAYEVAIEKVNTCTCVDGQRRTLRRAIHL